MLNNVTFYSHNGIEPKKQAHNLYFFTNFMSALFILKQHNNKFHWYIVSDFFSFFKSEHLRFRARFTLLTDNKESDYALLLRLHKPALGCQIHFSLFLTNRLIGKHSWYSNWRRKIIHQDIFSTLLLIFSYPYRWMLNEFHKFLRMEESSPFHFGESILLNRFVSFTVHPLIGSINLQYILKQDRFDTEIIMMKL